jgi:hypothetical protein
MTCWKDMSSRLLALGCFIGGLQILASLALAVSEGSPATTHGPCVELPSSSNPSPCEHP